MNKRKTGAFYEEAAAGYLTRCGCRIVARNFRCRAGEIDVIAIDESDEIPVLVFAEVKYRGSRTGGYPEEAVTPRKQQTIRKVALYYMAANKIRSGTPCRFDVVAIEGGLLRHIRNAF